MNRWMSLLALGLAVGGGQARAQEKEYSPPKAVVSSREDSFDRSVNLKRFRKGSPQWDTQELIASGLTALHGEHLRILEELAALKAAVAKLQTEGYEAEKQ